MKPVNLGIVGIGGFGRMYMRLIQAMEAEGSGRLISAVVRNRAKYAEEVEGLEKERGVAIRSSLAEMLAEDGDRLEIVAIPTGIPTHCPLLIESVEGGKDVILEKPPAATIQDIDRMLEALQRTGRWCQVGFQNQGNPTVVGLKRMICDGRIGAITSVTVKGLWVRRDSYYARNPWSGKIRSPDGWTLDGTVNNPMAHYLMNALYFARPVWGEIAEPVSVQAELYRAHHIESEDTSAVRVETADGPRVHFFCTLAASTQRKIQIEIVGEKGRALWPQKGDVEIQFNDGTSDVIKDPGESYHDDVFRNPIKFLRGLADELNCPLEMTRSFVLAVNGAWMSAGVPHKIPDAQLRIYQDERTNSRAVEIPDIESIIDRASAEKKLYSELGVEWAVRTDPFSLDGFTDFDLALRGKSGARVTG